MKRIAIFTQKISLHFRSFLLSYHEWQKERMEIEKLTTDQYVCSDLEENSMAFVILVDRE